MAETDSKWEQQLKESRPRNFSGAVVYDILCRLPVKSILRFKTVCKTWYALFGDSQFVEAHLNRSIQESDRGYLAFKSNIQLTKKSTFSFRREENFEELCEFHVVCPYHFASAASANGIVCIWEPFLGYNRLNILLWNPATRESRKLPKFPGRERGYNTSYTILGFGFDPKNNDYKVVAISRSREAFEVLVYSLRTNRWTGVGKFGSFIPFLQVEPVHVNGRIHSFGRSLSRDKIVSFDISEEKMIELDVPEYNEVSYSILLESPENLGKSLILCYYKHLGYHVWYMKEYGDSKSWSELYYIPPHPIYGSLIIIHRFLDNGEIVMSMTKTRMVLYNPKTQGYKIINYDNIGSVFKYKESLVSVRGGGSINNSNSSALI